MTLAEYAQDVQSAVAAVDSRQAANLVRVLWRAHEEGRVVFVIGNGGSAANASHFSQDLAKGTSQDEGSAAKFRAVSLVDNVSWMTAVANDEGYERIFERQLQTLARPGDVLVAISGSGNSANVLNAASACRRLGLQTIAMTGFDGGELAGMADHVVLVPSNDMGVVESVHGILIHYAVSELRQRFAAAVVHRPVRRSTTACGVHP